MESKELIKLTALIRAKERVLLNQMELLANLYQQAVVKLGVEVEQKLLAETNEM